MISCCASFIESDKKYFHTTRLKMNNNSDYLVLLACDTLAKSKFRSSQQLSKKLKYNVTNTTLNKLRSDAINLLTERLFVAHPKNDGKQTPFKGHPVFIAQHATGSCCRKCLWKWHKIPKHKPVNEENQQFIIELLMYWINKQIN